jgi:hypothetical protein
LGRLGDFIKENVVKNKVICILLVLFALFVLAACVAVPAVRPINRLAQSLVALPPEGSLLITALVTAAVTWLLLKAAELLKMDLSGYVGPIVAIVAPILITAIESVLGMIPPAFDNIALTVIHLIVLIVASLGIYVGTGRLKNKQVKSLLA